MFTVPFGTNRKVLWKFRDICASGVEQMPFCFIFVPVSLHIQKQDQRSPLLTLVAHPAAELQFKIRSRELAPHRCVDHGASRAQRRLLDPCDSRDCRQEAHTRTRARTRHSGPPSAQLPTFKGVPARGGACARAYTRTIPVHIRRWWKGPTRSTERLSVTAWK